MTAPALALAEVTAVHGFGKQRRRVLAPTSLEICRGESLALVGPSGAGKSTLADVVLGLKEPNGGAVTVLGQLWAAPQTRPASTLRRLVQGVPQDPAASFVPSWTIRRSIEHAMRRLSDASDCAAQLASAAELAAFAPELLDRRPAELSGGQAQRAAITRAFAVGPAVIVADEPTSALDPATAAAVSTALLDSAREAGIALLVVTHDPDFAARCTQTLTINPQPPSA